VPKDYIAAEPSLCKKTQKLRGAAGPKRACLLAERRKETEEKESKLLYIDMDGSGGSSSKSIALNEFIMPEVTVPSSSDDDFIEVAPPLPRRVYGGQVEPGGRLPRRAKSSSQAKTSSQAKSSSY
jgi:hypothetical protein